MPLEHRIFRDSRQSLHWAVAVSLIVHAVVLFYPKRSSEVADHPARRLEARLAPRSGTPLEAKPPPAVAPAEIPPVKQKLLAMDQSTKTPAAPPPSAWSKAEKEDMNAFLRDLGTPAKPSPDIAQRALNMARAVGRQQARQDDESEVLVERRPDSPPVDPVSLEMYLDGMVKKLNRSAAFVKNDPRARGVRAAAVLVRISPSGSLQSFKVLYSGDQQDEIAYIQSVVERAVPFSAFPADLQKSAQSLAMIICILPAHLSGGGIGFARTDGGRC